MLVFDFDTLVELGVEKRAQETEPERTMIILLSVRFNGALLKREGLRRNGCSVITKGISPVNVV